MEDVKKKARSILSILDLSPQEVTYFCQRAIQIKHASSDPQTLRGRSVGIYFRKPSTRTRTAFMVGAGRLGATAVYFGPGDLQTSTGETIEDTARVLSGYLDVLVMRTNESADEMKLFAQAPLLSVVNALSSDEHPTQALADLTTILEKFGQFEGLSIVYFGEGNRTAAALALAISRMPGMQFTIVTPTGYGLDPKVFAAAKSLAGTHGAKIEQTHDLQELGQSPDVVYTSRWQEMGLAKTDRDWQSQFNPYRVSKELMNRVSKPGTVFMHDLPAVRGEDVDNEVLDGPNSLAWVQAQHKLFSAMAVLEWCATGPLG